MRFKPLVFGAALLGALTIGVVAAGATQTFKSGLYQNQPYSCANGSMIDPSGQSFGTFQVTETHAYPSQLVEAIVAVDNVKPNLTYTVTVTESGRQCISPVTATWNYEWGWPYDWTPGWWDYPITMYVGSNSHGYAHFWFWAHTSETAAYVTISNRLMTVRSMALPINR